MHALPLLRIQAAIVAAATAAASAASDPARDPLGGVDDLIKRCGTVELSGMTLSHNL